MAHTSEVTKTEDLIWRKELIFVPSLSRNKFSCWSANFRTFHKKTNNNRKKFRISSDQQAISILLFHSVLSILFFFFFLVLSSSGDLDSTILSREGSAWTGFGSFFSVTRAQVTSITLVILCDTVSLIYSTLIYIELHWVTSSYWLLW